MKTYFVVLGVVVVVIASIALAVAAIVGIAVIDSFN